MLFFRSLLVLTVAICLFGCSGEEFANRLIPDEARPTIDQAIEAIENKNSDVLMPLLDPALINEETSANLQQIWDYLPDEQITDLTLVWTQTFWSSKSATSELSASPSNVQTLDLTYRAVYPSASFQVLLNLRNSNDLGWSIVMLNFAPIPSEVTSPTDWQSLETDQKVVIALAVGVPVFVLLTLVASFFFRHLKRRILWTLFILFGFPVFATGLDTINWTLVAPAFHQIGDSWHMQLFEFKLLGLAFEETMTAGWQFEIGVPLGALLFWYRVLRGGPTRKDASN